MKIFTIDDIRSWNPCYDPIKHLPEGWSGAAIDILKHDAIPPEDKLWVVCREDLIDAKTLRLFAVWCARQVQHLMTDERSIAVLDVAERYANGQATEKELAAARDAAWAAARDAAWAAARDAAWEAAREAARDAAWAAARDAAWEAARAAARAAWAADWDADWDDAREAARAAAWAARNAQIAKLIEMVEGKL